MRINLSGIFFATAAIGFGLLIGTAAPAHAEFRFVTGFDFTSGDYGASDDTYILSVPLTIKYEGTRALFRVTVPYTSISAREGGDIVAFGPEGEPIREGSGDRTTVIGAGDIVAALSYNVINSSDSGTFVDVTGKIKFGTADEDKGLGTGENDYSLQLDLFQTINRSTLILTAGYRVYGDPPGVDFDNVFYGSLGGAFKLSAKTSAGLIYDYREKILASSDPQRELTAYIARKTDDNSKVQFYVLGGFTDASPDWGIGATYNVGF